MAGEPTGRDSFPSETRENPPTEHAGIPEELGLDPARAEALLRRVRHARPEVTVSDEASSAWLELARAEARLRARIGEPPALEQWAAVAPEWSRAFAREVQENDASRSLEARFQDARPPTVPGFEIRHVLGRGGMSVVYMAWQTRLARHVALKTIRDPAPEPDLVARLRREAQVLARLDHPNIVQIHEVGESDGRPHVVLEYVAGGGLERHLAGTPRPASEAAELTEILARAVQSAHDRGIVHRDLKPSNVLLAPLHPDSASTPGPILARFRPKIGDFGLAKPMRLDVAGEEGLSRSGLIAGTPSYMAPEQARGDSSRVGPAADVHALGAILYELLTGRPPFVAAGMVETLLLVVGEDPIPPTRLQPRLPRDLETVCLKCLAKEPESRYHSALELAEDLARWRSGRSVLARPAPAWERALKWSKRRPAAAGLLVVAACLLAALPAVGVAISYTTRLTASLKLSQAARRAEESARHRAEAAERRATSLDYHHRVLLAAVEWRDANATRARELLAECKPELRGWEWHYLNRVCGPTSLRMPAPAELYGVAVSPDGRKIAGACRDGNAIVWDAESGQLLARAGGHSLRVYGVAFSPDSRRLVTASSDTTARVWELASGKRLLELDGHRAEVRSAIFSPDGQIIASAGKDARILLWNALTGALLAELVGSGGQDHSLAFRPDGRALAHGGLQGIRLFDVESRRLIRAWDAGGVVRGVAFDPKGTRIATASEDGAVKVWDLATEGPPRWVFRDHASKVYAIAWRDDGAALASGGMDTSIRIWDPVTGRPIRQLGGHEGRVYGVAWNPANGQVVSASTDRTVRTWNLSERQGLRSLRAEGVVRGLAWLPDGSRLASTTVRPQTLQVWDPRVERPLARVDLSEDRVNTLAASPAGDLLALGSAQGLIQVHDAKTATRLAVLTETGAPVVLARFSDDGRYLAAARADRSVEFWDPRAGRSLGVLGPEGSDAASEAGAAFATTPIRRLLATIPREAFPIRGIAWSPGGGLVAAPLAEPEVRVWDARGETVRRLRGHTHGINSIAWTPDGSRLASASSDRTVRVWDPWTGELTLTLDGHQSEVNTVAWSPDGGRLASGSSGGEILIWDGEPQEAR